MEKRREFLGITFGFLAGAGLWMSPFFSFIRVACAKAKKMILPRDTKRESLIDKNPADLDTRYLDPTPLKDFSTMGITDYEVNVDAWRLEVAGRVKRPFTLTYTQILALPSIEREVLLICPGFFANHGRWKGVPMGELLDRRNLEKGVTLVTFFGQKGEYERMESFPMEDVFSNKVFLAYGVNGETLPKKHGFPLRIVAKDYYGFNWLKYVYRVKLE